MSGQFYEIPTIIFPLLNGYDIITYTVAARWPWDCPSDVLIVFAFGSV